MFHIQTHSMDVFALWPVSTLAEQSNFPNKNYLDPNQQIFIHILAILNPHWVFMHPTIVETGTCVDRWRVALMMRNYFGKLQINDIGKWFACEHAIRFRSRNAYFRNFPIQFSIRIRTRIRMTILKIVSEKYELYGENVWSTWCSVFKESKGCERDNDIVTLP